MIPKIGISLPKLGIVLAVAAIAGCATAQKKDDLVLNANCIIQPVGSQGGVLLARVMCDAAE